MIELQTLNWTHQPTGQSLSMTLDWHGTMSPSASTHLLLTHMNIRPGESVLDLGAGNGVIGCAALLLGARRVMFTDLDPVCDPLIKANLARLREQTGREATAQVTVGNLFSPVHGQRFDHILVNPPSIPSLNDDLPLAYRSGPAGRLFHDAIQALAGYYLTDGGRLTFIQGSLSNRPVSLARLQALDYQLEVSDPVLLPLRPYYPHDWLHTLAARGEAELIHQDGIWHEARCVIQATREQAATTGVMRQLSVEGVPFRVLPHLRQAPTVERAAAERGVPAHEMIKCILLKDRQARFVLACLAGNADLDTQRVRLAMPDLTRLSFSTPDEITRVTGHVLGSVAPLSLRESIPVVLDEELRALARVNISSGDPWLGLELKLADLLRVLGGVARFAPIRKEAAPAA
ncbi:MAG: YbaK/EbsC family protein [Burkholderiales bacterium]|jgi:Cys-tRNA(Pro)/Cys-tRNA(Cys) deacylase